MTEHCHVPRRRLFFSGSGAFLMGRTSTTSKSSFAAIASWRLTFAGEQVGPIFRFFFLIGFGAKALSQGRKGFAFFFACLLALFPLSCPLSLALSFPSLSLSLSLHSSRPPHGRRLRRVRHRGRSLARPRREAARLPRQPVRRAVPRARRRPRRRPRQRGQAATGRAGQPRATPSRAAVHRRGGGRRRVPARAKDGKGGGRRGGGGREGEQRRGIEPEDGGRGGGAGVPADKPRSDAPPRPAGRRLHLEPGRKALGGGLRRV